MFYLNDLPEKLSKYLYNNTPTFRRWYKLARDLLAGRHSDRVKPAKFPDYKYVVSSRLLYECFHYLNQDKCNESLVDVSGIRFNEAYVMMERMECVEHDTRNSVYARSNLMSTYRTLMRIDSYGGLLAGVFHIHPGKGPGSIDPSATDINDQARREKMGMKAIGAIFSRDGYFRFFSKDLGFNVEVVGKGVKRHGRYLYQFEDTCNL